MKKVILMAVAAAFMCGCEKQIVADNEPDADASGVVTVDGKRFTFTCKGDFGSPTFTDFSQGDASAYETGKSTRAAYLQADGADMTDLWVFDFVGDECVQTIHQSSTDDDFGRPVMTLAYGSHHVYFVASRGAEPSVDATACTISWTRPSDTFWKDYEVSVVSTSNGNRAVTLDRVVTRLRVTVNDEVPATMATLSVTPAVWYYGVNYKTGEPSGASEGQERSVAVPASYQGTSGQLSMSIFGFSGSEEWTTGLTIKAKDGDGAVLGQANIEDAPLKRNRVTEYSGNLFSSGSTMTASLAGDWAEGYSGTW